MPRLEPTQENREFSVTTPLGEDVLLFHAMSASEELGALFYRDLLPTIEWIGGKQPCLS